MPDADPTAPAGGNRDKSLVTIATYNEIENLPSLVEEIFQQCRRPTCW